MRHKSNNPTSGKITSCLQEFCPPSFEPLKMFLTDERQEMRTWQVWKRVTMTNYPQSKTNPHPSGKNGCFHECGLEDLTSEKDFKKWTTTLINQPCVSNQTSKTFNAEGWWLSRVIHWWKWWEEEVRRSLSPRGGESSNHAYQPVQSVKVVPSEI